MQRALTGLVFVGALCGVLLGAVPLPAFGEETVPVHGLWVWKTPSILDAPRGGETLRDFCRSEAINEVYLSISRKSQTSEDSQLAALIALLHRSNIRVEALLSSADADEPGKSREKLLDEVRGIAQFNQMYPRDRFDGIHLDIEPQQRPENKGAGNLRFLPGLLDAYRAVRAVAQPARMTVNADIPNKFLKGDLDQRKHLFSSVPRLTLMLYELSSPDDGESHEKKVEKLQQASQKYLEMAYQGLSDPNLAKMSIALRTPDYVEQMPAMLKTLDETFRANPHYLGWAWHSYSDAQKAVH